MSTSLISTSDFMKKVAILQSNYIPWKGYFDLIAAVDEFIIYDDVQYTRRDWRNRNIIKTPQGVKWLTVPVSARGNYYQKISDMRITGDDWTIAHWKSLVHSYSRAPYFSEIASWLEPLYRNANSTHISQLNSQFISTICKFLGINTRISHSHEYKLIGDRTERLANLCLQLGATEYISGPAAKDYLNEKNFVDLDIKVTWFDYADYPEYPQLWGKFIHEVSILDLLFHCGKNSPHFMRYLD